MSMWLATKRGVVCRDLVSDHVRGVGVDVDWSTFTRFPVLETGVRVSLKS